MTAAGQNASFQERTEACHCFYPPKGAPGDIHQGGGQTCCTGKLPALAWLIFTVTLVVVFVVAMIVSAVVERRAEAVFAYTPAHDLSEWEARNEEWGKRCRSHAQYLLDLQKP